VLNYKETVQVAACTVDVLQLCMMRSSRVVAAFLVAICIHSVSAQDQVVKISLDKRTLSADALAPQKRAEQLGLLQSSNGGEDIPILNFLDAQVIPATVAPMPSVGSCYLISVNVLPTCSITGRLALALLLRSSWSSSTLAAPTCGCHPLSVAGSALLATFITSTTLPTLLHTRYHKHVADLCVLLSLLVWSSLTWFS